MITVVNKYTHKPTSNDIFIGRGTPLGNPFTHADVKETKAIIQCNSREEAIERYEEYLREAIASKFTNICNELNRLYNLAKENEINLVCTCAPKKCHGEIIKAILEEKLKN